MNEQPVRPKVSSTIFFIGAICGFAPSFVLGCVEGIAIGVADPSFGASEAVLCLLISLVIGIVVSVPGAVIGLAVTVSTVQNTIRLPRRPRYDINSGSAVRVSMLPGGHARC